MRASAEFVTSATSATGFPRERLPELAMVGRSNVGKSSLINALVRQRVARTSAAPGKTRLANFYRVAPEALPPFYLVDLPGYGYTRAPRRSRGASSSPAAGRQAAVREFEAITGAYFGRQTERLSLSADARTRGRLDVFLVLLLVDSRHPGLDSDLQARHWLESRSVPAIVVATKIDKLSRAECKRQLGELERLHASPVLGVSARSGEGLKELWEQIETRLLRPTGLRKPEPPSPLPNK